MIGGILLTVFGIRRNSNAGGTSVVKAEVWCTGAGVATLFVDTVVSVTWSTWGVYLQTFINVFDK